MNNKIKDVSQSTNLYEIVEVISQLNPTVDIRIADMRIDPMATNKFYSSVPVGNLVLPEGFYYNDKNEITNKHRTKSGAYCTLKVEELLLVNDRTLIPVPKNNTKIQKQGIKQLFLNAIDKIKETKNKQKKEEQVKQVIVEEKNNENKVDPKNTIHDKLQLQTKKINQDIKVNLTNTIDDKLQLKTKKTKEEKITFTDINDKLQLKTKKERKNDENIKENATNKEIKNIKMNIENIVKIDGRYSLKKDEIIQDLPLNSKEISVFKTPGMTDEEILLSQKKLLEFPIESEFVKKK